MGSWLSTAWDPSTGISDLSGKVAVVTGANAGIGYATTIELARHGAKVYLASRSENRALAAIEKMHAESPKIQKGNLIWLPLDLMDLESVVQAADTSMQKEERLDLLVNNAGVATDSYQTTPAGFEVTMGVNHLAHSLFTVNLIPILKRTAAKDDSDVRVVTVSSSGHAMLIPKHIRFDKLDDFKYHGMTSSPNFSSTRDLFSRYALSKLANILFCKELQRRFDLEKVPITSMTNNPGGTNTQGGMSVWPVWLRPVMSRLFVPASKGALPVLYQSGAPEIKRDPAKYKAVYFNPSCKIEAPSALARDGVLAKNLWKTSEEALGTYIKG
ncbi:NAD(P)-binding protein [Rhizodiscina lignyota]|uniref:NAD(P)-binding protein n=1 Tax=Rhizodiscina lignyota TaxID=1504668 RepID=A0A9P4ISQ3_9PEZI|nr:NAD(P)-binding protein [Rhizodiscina lignyota]